MASDQTLNIDESTGRQQTSALGLGARHIIYLLLLAVVAVGSSTVNAFAATTVRPGQLAGAKASTGVSATTYPSSVQWGLWEPSWQLSNGGTDFNAITNVESELNHHADIVHWFAGWSESWADYDGGLAQQVAQSGRTPMITWEPTGISLPSITSGSQDTYIDSWARGMAAMPGTRFYVRIFHEFNDPLTSTSGYAWGVGGGTGNQPADLVAAWRHVRGRFTADGASNVKFLWCPDGANDNLNLLRAAYPGDAYVDYGCFDNYDYNITQVYQTMSQVTHKPLLLAEVSSTSSTWVNNLASQLNVNQLPNVRGVVWFDDSTWRLDSMPTVRTAVKTMLAGSAFSGPVRGPRTVSVNVQGTASPLRRS